MKSKIVIDCISLLSPFTGIGRYTYENAKRVSKDESCEWSFYYGFYSKKLYGGKNSITKIKSLMTKKTFFKKAVKKLLVLYTKYFCFKTFDLYWQPNYIPDLNVKAKKRIVSVHDFSFYLNPSWHPKERLDFFEKNFWKNIKKADRIITGSFYTKHEIEKYLKIDPLKIDVIYHGVDHNIYKEYDTKILEEFREKLRLPKEFFLFVGSVEPRKNLLFLMNSYSKLPKEIKRKYKLLIVGFKGWENEKVKELLDKESENILYIGYLSDIELAYIYNLAKIFIYPSLYEGFGIPPLEAMACKTCTIVSNRASLPEICAEGALYTNPLNEEDLIKKILKILENEKLQKELIQKGYNRAKNFDWEKSAMEHLEVFKREIDR